MLAAQTENLVSVTISRELARRLQLVTLKNGLGSSDECASYIMNSVLNEIESGEKLELQSRAKWGRGGGDDDNDDEIREDHSLTAQELEKIREELRPLIWISC